MITTNSRLVDEVSPDYPAIRAIRKMRRNIRQRLNHPDTAKSPIEIVSADSAAILLRDRRTGKETLIEAEGGTLPVLQAAWNLLPHRGPVHHLWYMLLVVQQLPHGAHATHELEELLKSIDAPVPPGVRTFVHRFPKTQSLPESAWLDVLVGDELIFPISVTARLQGAMDSEPLLRQLKRGFTCYAEREAAK